MVNVPFTIEQLQSLLEILQATQSARDNQSLSWLDSFSLGDLLDAREKVEYWLEKARDWATDHLP